MQALKHWQARPRRTPSPCDDRISALVDAVQANCHVADARHAPDLSLCIYLLQMREFYRWEQGHGFAESLDRNAVGRWLSEREALWSELESREFVPLSFGRRGFDPFDAPGLNAALASHGLVYGAGLASAARPTFFLAHLDS
ncbi:MAG: Sfum_1244 family protein, partial [Burkholderiaceae bacterium]